MRPIASPRHSTATATGVLCPVKAAPFMRVVVLSAEVGLVHLDAAVERRAAELRQATAQLVQPGPGRLVLEPVLAGDVHRRAAALADEELADDAEPEHERLARAMEDGAGGEGDLMTAAHALVQRPPPQSPGTASAAPRTAEAVRPALPPQVLDAAGLGREALLELPLRRRKIADPAHRSLRRATMPLRSNLQIPSDTTGGGYLSDPDTSSSLTLWVRVRR